MGLLLLMPLPLEIILGILMIPLLVIALYASGNRFN